MKFEVGDRVRVTKSSQLCEMYDINVGDIGTILRMSGDGFYYVQFIKLALVTDTYHVTADGCIVIHEQALKKVEESKEIMTLKDLRSGMVVETRDSDRFLILVAGDDIHMMCGDGARHMGQWEVQQLYHDDLTRKNGFNEHDIMKVYYRVESFYKVSATENLLWERKEIKEMTVSEIEEVLGYSVKVVADHE